MDACRSCRIFFAVAIFALFATSAQAALWTANVLIDGLQETPAVVTPGSGTAVVTFDDISGAMNVNGTFSGLIGTVNNAHIHGYAAAGTPAEVVFGLTFSAAMSGSISGAGIIPPAKFADVLGGLTYINIHSTDKPGGEIRGQVVNFVVPEPATSGLLGLAGLGLLQLRKRR